MTLLIQLAFLWVTWLISPRRWRQPLTVLFTIMAIILIGISPLGIQLGLWGLTVGIPADTGETVDAIVVLGRGTPLRDLRVAVAQNLWQSQRATQIFASGMMDARSIVTSLVELEIPAQHLSGEECSQSTQENALFTMAILRPQNKQRILLITDPPHLLRSLLIFRRVGFQVIPHPTALPAQFALQEKQRSLLREYLALIQFALAGKLADPVPDSFVDLPAGVLERMRDWNCQVQGIP